MSTTGGYYSGHFEAFDEAYVAVPGGIIAYDREAAKAWYALNRRVCLYLDRGDGSEMPDIGEDFEDELQAEEDAK